MKILSTPLYILKLWKHIIQTQICMQKCKWFFRYVIPQMFDKWETDQYYSAFMRIRDL